MYQVGGLVTDRHKVLDRAVWVVLPTELIKCTTHVICFVESLVSIGSEAVGINLTILVEKFTTDIWI